MNILRAITAIWFVVLMAALVIHNLDNWLL